MKEVEKVVQIVAAVLGVLVALKALLTEEATRPTPHRGGGEAVATAKVADMLPARCPTIGPTCGQTWR